MSKDQKDKKSKSSKEKKPPPPANNIFLSLMRAAAVQIKQPTAPTTTSSAPATDDTPAAPTSASASSVAPSITTTPTTTSVVPSTTRVEASHPPQAPLAQATAVPAPTPPAAEVPVPTTQPPTQPPFAPNRQRTQVHSLQVEGDGGKVLVPPTILEDTAVLASHHKPSPENSFPIVTSSALPSIRSTLGYRRRPTAVDVNDFQEWRGGSGANGDDGGGVYRAPTLFTMDLPFLINATPQPPPSSSTSSSSFINQHPIGAPDDSINGGATVADAAARRLGANLRSVLPPTHPLFNTIVPTTSEPDLATPKHGDEKANRESSYTNAPHHYQAAGLRRERQARGDTTEAWVQSYVEKDRKYGHGHEVLQHQVLQHGVGQVEENTTTKGGYFTTPSAAATATSGADGAPSNNKAEYLSKDLEGEYVTTPTDYTFMRLEHFNLNPYKEVPMSLLTKCGMSGSTQNHQNSKNSRTAEKELPGNDDCFYRLQNSFVGTPEIAAETFFCNDLLLAISEHPQRPQQRAIADDYRNVYAEANSSDGAVRKGDLRGRWIRRIEGVENYYNNNTKNNTATDTGTVDSAEVFVPVSSRYAAFLVPKGGTNNHSAATTCSGGSQTVVDDSALRRYAISQLQQQKQPCPSSQSNFMLPHGVSLEGFASSSSSPSALPLLSSGADDDGENCDADEEPIVKIMGVVKRNVTLNTPAAFTFSPTAMEIPQGRTLSFPPSSLLPSLVSGSQHILPYSYTPVYHMAGSEQKYKREAYADAPAPPLFQGEGGLLQRVREGRMTEDEAAEMGVVQNSNLQHSKNILATANILIPILVAAIGCDEEVPRGPSPAQMEAITRREAGARSTLVNVPRLREILSKLAPNSGMCLIHDISALPEMRRHNRHNILRSLNTITYTFTNGAFRTSRFLFGEDPRNSAEKYAIYQQISFRFTKYKTIATLLDGLANLPFKAESALKASRDLAHEFIVRARAYLGETSSSVAPPPPPLPQNSTTTSASSSSSPQKVSRGEKKARATMLSVRALRERSIHILEEFLSISPADFLAASKNKKLSNNNNCLEGRALSFPAALADILLGSRRRYSIRLIDAVSGSWHLTQALGEATPLKKCAPNHYGYYSEALYKSLNTIFESELVSYLQDRVVGASEEFVRGGGEVAVAAFLNQNSNANATTSSAATLLNSNDGDADNEDENDDDLMINDSLSSRETPSQTGADGSDADDDLDSILGELEDVRAEGEYEGAGDDDEEEEGSDGFEDFESSMLPASPTS